MHPYKPFADEAQTNNDNAPFSRVFVSGAKIELQPYFDPIGKRQVTPNLDTTQTNMVISRSFLSGFQRDEFIIWLVQNKITYEDFDNLIDKLENDCGRFRLLKVFFLLMIVNIIAGATFLLIYSFNHFRNIEGVGETLLWLGLGVLIIGGFICLLLIVIILKYYAYVIRRELILENSKIARKGLFWNVSSMGQCLNLEIQQPKV